MKLIEVVADPSDLHTLASFIAEQYGAMDYWYGQIADEDRQSIRMLVDDAKRQAVLDSLQELLSNTDNARIVVLPVEAVLPRSVAADERGQQKTDNKISSGATREELYNQIEKGAHLNSNYIVLVMLSTVVAAIGLLENNIAVIIGAMVIAPLLGPNLALSFAATLGDVTLMRNSLFTNLVGLTLALALSIAIAWIWPIGSFNAEIMARTNVGFDSVILALASGAAAALSLSTGLASALVGVMVAVALLPPTATLGMMLASMQMELAAGAALLLAVNIVSVNLSANLVFLIKGVRPRTWIEKRQAQQSVRWVGLFWTVALVMLLLAVYLRNLVGA
jgi:uncharacterized hydrophobic protein (TIGR00341 family)